MKFTGLSFIIAHRPTDKIDSTIESIKSSMQDLSCRYEILSAEGNHPTYQRNKAVKKSLFSHLYFLDDDSKVNSKSIKILIDILKTNQWKEQNISLIGGPALLLEPSSYFEKCVDAVLTSEIVVGKIKARYKSVGAPRLSNDQEMILCNLIVDKDHFNQLNKFDTKLYPNEENDFIYRLLFAQQQKNDSLLGKVLYHPEIFVERPQRKNLKSFIKQMMNYGRGRAEQTKKNFKTLHLHLLLAIFFFLLILLIPISSLLSINLNYQGYLQTYEKIMINFSLIYFLYSLYIFTKKSVYRKKILFYVPLLVFSCHFFYGLGLFLGFFQKGFKADNKKIEFKIKQIFRY